METFLFGHSSQKLPILEYRFGKKGPQILILGGVHGDESEGVIAANGLLAELQNNQDFKLSLSLVPIFNPDGVFAGQRLNGNGVDLNRNLPTKDWSPEIAKPRYNPGKSAASEPETKALMTWFQKNSPQLIISLHSYKPMLNTNGDCTAEAKVIHEHTNYPIVESIGYPTPGCLGTLCAFEMDIPTLTYEIERGQKHNEVLTMHIPAILAALKVSEERFSQ